MEGIKMKLNKNALRKLILKEMKQLNEYSDEERDAYNDYVIQTHLIIDNLAQALEAASVFDGHEDIKEVIEGCLDRVEALVRV
jgi:membrane peptidoglycan carboxypeptidase